MTELDEQGRPEPPLTADEATTIAASWSSSGDADGDWEWHSASEDTPEQLHARWQDAVCRSRPLVAEALADGGLERPAAWIDDWYGVAPSLRWILLHLIREYARHTGHADLLREAVDGLTGE